MKRTFRLLALVSLLLLTACLATTPSPKPLRLSGASYQSTADAQLAIAVDASGRKHITKVECRTDTGKSCRIIYQSTHVGEQDAYQGGLPALATPSAIRISRSQTVGWRSSPGKIARIPTPPGAGAPPGSCAATMTSVPTCWISPRTAFRRRWWPAGAKWFTGYMR